MSAPPVYKLEKHLCRCCHAEGSFFNLGEPVYSQKDSLEFSEEEVYSEMLKNCLDLEILPMEGDLSLMTYTICGDCVLRLREANNFKQQVTVCEDRFRLMYKCMILDDRAAKKVKTEEEQPGKHKEEVVKNELNTLDGGFDIRFDDSDEEQPVIEIKVEEPKKAKPRPRARPQGIRAKRAAAKKSQLASSEKSQPATLEEPQLAPLEESQPPPSKDQAPCEASIEAPSVASSASTETPSNEPSILERALVREKKKGLEPEQYAVIQNDVYKCIVCLKSFKVHMQERLVKCQICGKQFYSNTQLRKHTPAHRNKNWGTWTEYTALSTSEGTVFRCNQCSRVFRKRNLYSQHFKYVHAKMRPNRYRCRLCSAMVTNTSRTSHMEKYHDIPAPKCNICDKKFLYPHLLINHQRIEHLGEKNFTCEICAAAFATSSSLTKHKFSHVDQRPWDCKLCGKSFKQKKNLKKHMAGHPKNVICPICDAAFCVASDLKEHLEEAHPELF